MIDFNVEPLVDSELLFIPKFNCYNRTPPPVAPPPAAAAPLPVAPVTSVTSVTSPPSRSGRELPPPRALSNCHGRAPPPIALLVLTSCLTCIPPCGTAGVRLSRYVIV